MKSRLLVVLISISYFVVSCDLLGGDDGIKGAQSPMGEVGETATASISGISGVSNVTATVTSLEDGVSTFSGQATVTNPVLLNIISNIPELTVEGNTVTGSGLKYKMTKKGIESKNSTYPGILVNYDSKVGDTYSGASGYEREVVSKSETDDYPYGFFLIKVMEIEEVPCSVPGVKKLTYYANHKFGIVGANITYEDNSTMNVGLGYSAQND